MIHNKGTEVTGNPYTRPETKTLWRIYKQWHWRLEIIEFRNLTQRRKLTAISDYDFRAVFPISERLQFPTILCSPSFQFPFQETAFHFICFHFVEISTELPLFRYNAGTWSLFTFWTTSRRWPSSKIFIQNNKCLRCSYRYLAVIFVFLGSSYDSRISFIERKKGNLYASTLVIVEVFEIALKHNIHVTIFVYIFKSLIEIWQVTISYYLMWSSAKLSVRARSTFFSDVTSRDLCTFWLYSYQSFCDDLPAI